jgi:hypothetical protein
MVFNFGLSSLLSFRARNVRLGAIVRFRLFMRFLLGMSTSSGICSWVGSPWCNGVFVLVTNHLFAALFLIWNGNQIDLLIKTYLSTRLPKVISSQSFLTISFIFSDCFIKEFKLGYWKKILKGRRINKRKKMRTFF